MPVLASGNSPPTLAPLVTPRNCCASASLARSSIDLSLGIRTNERIAGVGGLCRRPKCSDSACHPLPSFHSLAVSQSAFAPWNEQAAIPIDPRLTLQIVDRRAQSIL